MAERIVSPGVFTNEVDQSYLAGGIAQIGAAIVGPTLKGPALIPTQISNYGEFVSKFGSYTDDSYVPFVVQDYLKSGNVITVTRLLYEDGYKLTNGGLAILAESSSTTETTKIVTHVLHPTLPVTTDGASNVFEKSTLSSGAPGSNGSFTLTLSGSFAAAQDNAIGFSSFTAGNGASIPLSIVSSNNNYVSTTLGNSPKSIQYPVYVQYENPTATSAFATLAHVTMSLAYLPSYELVQDYTVATTPWVTSQKQSGTAINLFRFHTLSHGTNVNYETKIGIRDIVTLPEAVTGEYPTFTVEIRRVNNANLPAAQPYYGLVSDTDESAAIETYSNVNLDPTSPRYIARVIGDKVRTIDNDGRLSISGDYENLSAYVRVEVTNAVKNKTNNSALIPFGFRAVTSPIPNASASFNLKEATYTTSQVGSTGISTNTYFGFNFSVTNNLNYLAPIPTSGSTTGSNADFYLGDVSQDAALGFPSSAPYSLSLQGALTGSTMSTNVALSTRKFIVPFQGGFDGAKPNMKKYSGENITAANTFGFACNSTTSAGTTAYNKAFALLGNTDYYDMNLLVTPGIIHSLHPIVTNAARNLAEARQDTFYVMDSNAITDSLTTVANQISGLDSSYTSTYWPWLQIRRPDNNVSMFVPPSVMIPGVLAFTDQNAHPWYAPAGLNRGSLTGVSATKINLTQADRDTLYNARVNPIANFPNEGVVVWGQKTLQARPSALDRVNVRRLLIAVKKYIASSTRYLVFEQNTDATRLRFLSIVNPYLENVKNKQGLYQFRVVMDQSNNTPDLIDQNILYGQIFLQPTRTAEFIILDFNIQPTGASFSPGL